MSSTEEQQQQSSNIGEEEENSNNMPNSESIDDQQQQQDVAAEMASSLARSAEISDDGELPHPDNNNDRLAKTSSISSSTSTVLSPLQRKLIADQNSRVGSSIDNRSFGTCIEGRSIGNTINRSVDQSITSSIYGNSTVDSHHSWNPVSSSVASSSLGRSQVIASCSGERVEETQDVNKQEGNINQDSASIDIEIGQQNNVQSNNIEQQQQQTEEEPQPIAISNMDQIGNAERRQSRRRSTQETDGTPIAIPVDSVHSSSSRRSRQRVSIFNATRVDTSNHRNEEEDIVDGRRKRQRQVCMVCFLIIIIGGLSVILGILLSPTTDNGEKKDTSEEMIQEVVSPTTEVLSVPVPLSIEPTIQPSQSQSTSLPSIQPTITTIPTEPIPTSSPTINPTESPTQILYYPDWSNQLCINDPKNRPVGYAIVQGRQPLFQTLEACCNSQFWWDVNGCLIKSNGSTTIEEQTVSPSSLNPTSPPSVMMTPLSPITLVPSVSPLQSPISSTPTRSPTILPTQFPTNQPSSNAPTRQPITSRPTDEPSNSPSDSPVLYPTTSAPSKRPTNKPTALPTRMIPTAMPTTLKPTPKPTLIITSRPTKTPEKTWQPLGDIISGEGGFGHSVSLSSDAQTLAIWAPNYGDESNTNIGQVQIYTWVESTWQQLGQTITGDRNNDEFGSAVSLSASGLTLAVSSPKSDINGESSGSVSVYTWDEATSFWQQLGQTINGETAGDNFGFSLSLSPDGRTLAASSPYSNSGGLSSGSVRVFTWNTETEEWLQIGGSINGSMLSFSGWSISLSASRTVAIGARQSASGSVKVYTYNDDSMNWIQQGFKLTGQRGGDYYGHAVSISSNGSIMAVGAPRHDFQAGLGITNTGQVKIYKWNGTIWTQVGQSINGIESGQQLGWSVDLSADGNSVALASYNPNSDNRGEVTVYKRKNDNWQLVGQTISGDDGWCYDVSLDGDGTTLVGSSTNTDSTGNVRVFQFTSEKI